MITLNVSSKKPFGLLSPKADTPFFYEKRLWPTVNHYNYINVFQDEKTRQRMSDHIFKNPFVFMHMIKNAHDQELYKTFLYSGLKKRFQENGQLRQRLAETKNFTLVYPDLDILAVLYDIRDDTQVFDSIRGVYVDKKEVECVVEGVTTALLNNETIDEDSTYTDLLFYKSSSCVPLPRDDKIFLNINRMVPVIQYRNKTELWIRQLLRFKKHLMSVYLDFILETEYPDISTEDYTLAKNQQLNKEPNITRLENQLYNLYIEGNIDDLILRRLLFEPEMTLEQQAQEEQRMEEYITLSNTDDEKIYIDDDDPFLPHYIEPVKIDGSWFSSTIHYVYSKLFQTITTGTLDMDILNDIPLNEIQNVYDNEKNQYLHRRLKENNEVATTAKFEAWPELKQLLFLTNEEIIYNDETDPVLGTGLPEKENLVGRFLNYKRSNDKIPIMKTLSENMSDNIWFSSWMKDYTTRLLYTGAILQEGEKTTENISAIMNVDVLSQYPPPTKKDVLFFQQLGVAGDTFDILYPIVVSKYLTFAKTKNPLKTAVDYYNNKMYTRSKSQLKHLYKKMSNVLILSEKEFVDFFQT